MNSVSTKSNQVSLASTEDGIHLVGSILWLDAQHTGDLSFVSSPNAASGQLRSKVIATEQTLKILEALRRKTRNALICQYNQPFAIGQLHLELLPSGAGLGGASLWIATGDRQVLYAPHIQLQRSPVCRQMQLKPVDTLILAAKIPFPADSLPNRKKEKERLVADCESYVAQGRYPVILCEPSFVAQELTKLLSDAGLSVAVHSSIAKVHKVYEQYRSPLGDYHCMSHRERNRGMAVSLFAKPSNGRLSLRKPLPDGPLLTIDDSPTILPNDGLFHNSLHRYLIPAQSDARDLKEVIAEVRPQQVYIFGPYAKEYVRHLRSAAPRVETLFPNHLPTLF